MTSLSSHQSASMADPTNRVTRVQRAFERCGDALCRYFTVRTSGDPHLVDDLMQQLWLQARLSCDDLREDDPEPWLWRIAQNLIRAHWREQRRVPANRITANLVPARSLATRFDTEDLPPEILTRREVREQLLLALTELAVEAQELLIGCYFEGRSHAELASALGISERAVEGRLYRARLALRDKLANLDMQED